MKNLLPLFMFVLTKGVIEKREREKEGWKEEKQTKTHRTENDEPPTTTLTFLEHAIQNEEHFMKFSRFDT